MTKIKKKITHTLGEKKVNEKGHFCVVWKIQKFHCRLQISNSMIKIISDFNHKGLRLEEYILSPFPPSIKRIGKYMLKIKASAIGLASHLKRICSKILGDLNTISLCYEHLSN